MFYEEDEIIKLGRKSFSRVGLMTLCILGISYALVYSLYAMPWGSVRETEAFLWLSNYVVLFGVAMPLSFLLVRNIPRRMFEKEKLNLGDVLRYYCMAEFTVLSSNFVSQDILDTISRAWNIEIIRPIADMVMETSLGWQLVIAVLIGPVAEEFVFRKIVLDRLAVFGEKQAVVISALAFALYHGNFEQYLYAFTMGVVFAYIYLRKGNIVYTIILHMMINFSGSIIPMTIMKNMDLEKLESLDMTGLNNGEIISLMINEGYLVYLIYLFAVLFVGGLGGALLVRGYRRRQFREAPLQLPKGKAFETCYCNPGMMLLTLGSVGLAVFSVLKNAGVI